MSQQPLIVWDFDDVLFPLTEAWFSSYGRELQTRVTHYAQIVENPPYNLMGISRSEYLDSLDAFRNSEEAQTIMPKCVISDWFLRSGDGYRHQVLSARPLSTLAAAQQWLESFFPGRFEHFGFVPAPRPGINLLGYPVSKKAYLIEQGISPNIFIDDNAETISDLGHIASLKAILWPAPWNTARNNNPDPETLIPG